MKKIAIIGAGLTGATIARICAEHDIIVDIFDKRANLGGMCADEMRTDGYYKSDFGPHIFHTSNEAVWNFVNRFAEFLPCRHVVCAKTDIGILPWPITLNTLSLVYNTNIDNALNLWKQDKNNESLMLLKDNFESICRSRVGEKVYRLLIENYSKKQWQRNLKELPAELCGRIPFFYDTNDNFFRDKYVAMPKHGYSKFIIDMLNHENINFVYETIKTIDELKNYNAVINTGYIDELHDVDVEYEEGISVSFEWACPSHDELALFEKGYTVINDCTNQTPYTRITNYSAFYDNNFVSPLVGAERPCLNGERYYPIRSVENILKHNKNIEEVKKKCKGLFISCGRCGSYKYLNMDEAISEAMKVAKVAVEIIKN